MHQNNLKRALLITLLALGVLQARTQGTFLNLNFESANVPAVPSGQAGDNVAASDGIPNWTAYYGSNPSAQILHNDISISSPAVAILGPTWGNILGIQIIEGGYSVVVQAGYDSLSPVAATISQTGLIPASALSIRLKAKSIFANPASGFGISIGGQNVPLALLSTTSTYSLYGGDISAFAGLTRDLRISALPTGYEYSSFIFDSIVFSNQPIPEPSALALLSLGALFLGWRLRRRRG